MDTRHIPFSDNDVAFLLDVEIVALEPTGEALADAIATAEAVLHDLIRQRHELASRIDLARFDLDRLRRPRNDAATGKWERD